MKMNDPEYGRQVQAGATRNLGGAKEFLSRVLLASVAVASALLLCELALRVGGYTPLYFNPLNAFHEPHPLVGYRGKPNFVGRFRKLDFDVVIAQDENGFRRPEHQLPRAESRMAVLAFGDSFTWGWGVGQGRVFTDVLSRLMPDVRVVNFGLNASGTVQQFALFEAYGKEQLQPGDVVLLMFFNNDFEENVSGRLRAEVRNGQVVVAGPARQLSFRPSDAVEGSSYLVNLVFFSANRLKAAIQQTRGHSRAERLAELGERAPEITVFRHYLVAFRDACREKDAHFVPVYIPEQAELGETPDEDENRLHNDQAFRRAFFDSTESLGLRTIDLLPPLLAAKHDGPPGQRLTFLHDGHWTNEGHEVAARAIAGFLSSLDPTSTQDARESRGGMTIYVDPASGAIAPPPPGPRTFRAPATNTAAFESYSEELLEIPGTTPAGGIKLDLQGRFRSAVVAHTRTDGTVETQCEAPGPNPRP
jgi:lysophospholipase L1-like esterase